MGEMSINSDDLKYGIECCIKYMACAPAEECCDLCPYHGRCGSLEKDALAYIQRLEANDSQVKKALQDNGYGSLEELLQAFSQVKAERDNAVKILTDIVHITDWFGDIDICAACKKDNCKECREYNEGFEWRGAQELPEEE